MHTSKNKKKKEVLKQGITIKERQNCVWKGASLRSLRISSNLKSNSITYFITCNVQKLKRVSDHLFACFFFVLSMSKAFGADRFKINLNKNP